MKRTFTLYRDKSLSDFRPQNDTQQHAQEVVAAYLGDLENARIHGQGLVFLGPVGVGKTMLASIILNQVAERDHRVESIELANYVGLMKEKFTLSQTLRELHEEEIADRLDKANEHIRYIQGLSRRCAEWVLFDDVGREYPSDSGWSQNEFLDTMRGRWNRGRPTILTTNLRWPALKTRYTDSLTSMLMESSTVIMMEGDDYRCRRAN